MNEEQIAELFTSLQGEVGAFYAVVLIIVAMAVVMMFFYVRSQSALLMQQTQTRARMDKIALDMLAENQRDHEEKTQLNKQISELRVKLAAMESESNTYKAQTERIIDTLQDNAKRETARYETDREKSRETINHLSSRVDELSVQNTELREEIATLKQLHKEVLSEIGEVKRARDVLQSELDSSIKEVKANEDIIQRLTERIGALESENRELKKQLEEMRHERENNKPDILIPDSVSVVEPE